MLGDWWETVPRHLYQRFMHSHAQTLFIFQVMEKKLMAKMLSQKQRYNLKFLTYEASEAPLHAFINLSILVMPNPSESTHELWRWMMWRIDKSKRGEIFITVLNIVSHLSDAWLQFCVRVWERVSVRLRVWRGCLLPWQPMLLGLLWKLKQKHEVSLHASQKNKVKTLSSECKNNV